MPTKKKAVKKTVKGEKLHKEITKALWKGVALENDIEVPKLRKVEEWPENEPDATELVIGWLSLALLIGTLLVIAYR